MELEQIIHSSNTFRVIGGTGVYKGVIIRVGDKYEIQPGGRINYDFEHDLYAGDEYLDKMVDYVDDYGFIKVPILCDSLAEAAKCISFDDYWERVTYTDLSDRPISVLLDIELEDTGGIDITEEIDSLVEGNGLNTLDRGSNYSGDDAATILGKAFAELIQPKPIEIGEKTIERIGDIVSSKNSLRLRDIDFDWGEDEFTVEVGELVGIDFDEIDMKIKSGIGAVIIEGVPGTGKTKAMVAYLNSKKAAGAYVEKITFHQECSYQDFIGGVTSKDGEFKYNPGVFTRLCYLAYKDPDREYYIGIDEFSRGNTESILGEVMTGICTRGMVLTLASGFKIKVPKNLYIIASRNVTDVNAKAIDLATYQRFSKVRLIPQWNNKYIQIVSRGDKEVEGILLGILPLMVKLNKIIEEDKTLGIDSLIGVRDITLENPTKESIIKTIKDNLIMTIERTTSQCYGDAKRVARETIDEIRRLCNDRESKI